MRHFARALKTVSLLAIRSEHAASGSANADYISGTALMGALAGLHRQAFSDDNETFTNLFLSEQIQFPNLYPASFPGAESFSQSNQEQDSETLPVYPIPQTAQSCKRHAGFLGDGPKDELPHGVHDTLF